MPLLNHFVILSLGLWDEDSDESDEALTACGSWVSIPKAVLACRSSTQMRHANFLA